MVIFCYVFGVYCSSYKYWKNCFEKLDGRWVVLCSQVFELYGISYGFVGVRSIVIMVI